MKSESVVDWQQLAGLHKQHSGHVLLHLSQGSKYPAEKMPITARIVTGKRLFN